MEYRVKRFSWLNADHELDTRLEGQRAYSLFENDKFKKVVKSAFRGAINSIDRELNGTPGTTYAGRKNSPIFGIIYIDRFIEKSRYIGKECTYQIDPSGEIEVFNDSSSIGWDLDENFEPFANSLTWKKLSARGKAQDGQYLPATLITKRGEKIDGRVLIEITR